MPWLCLALVPAAFVIACPMTALMIALGRRWRAYDAAGVPGQVKAPARRVPNTGGVAIFWGFALPVLLGFATLAAGAADRLAERIPALAEHLPGLRQRLPEGLLVLGGAAVLHVLGLIDDRKPLGPWSKLAIMALPAAAVVGLSPDTRLLTLLDPAVGGAWLSMVVTVLWFLVVTNAMNFMDNMDGLSAGAAAIAGACFLAATLINGQWFVAACLALLVGSCLGFLVFNAPRPGGAKIFMGDGGSLVLGFLLAFLTTRTTYIPAETAAGEAGFTSGPWYALFMPLVVLAIPLYDFTSVVAIRLSQGRSPFVGDLQHFSHRLVDRGLPRPAAVLVIHGLTAITGISGIALGALLPWQALLVGLQTFLILGVLALFEYAGRSCRTTAHRGDRR